MPSSICQRTALAAAISACFPAIALGAGVARVDFAVGDVTAVAPDGRSRPLSKGSEIDVGETVATQRGRAQLRFVDGAYMSLQPQTEFKVEQFKYSGKGKPDEGDSVVMNLLKGGLRTITGLIGRANRNNYRLRTDVATIGIRGTEYSVKYTNSIEVFCADGSILVQNEGGTLQLNGGQGGYVASNQTPPQQTENRPVLPPESPVDQQLDEPSKKPEDPDNEIQDSDEGVLPEITQPTVMLLTGTFQGPIAVSRPDGFFFGYPLGGQTTLELNASGSLVAFDDVEGEGGAQLASAQAPDGNDGIVAWGRWMSGTPTGTLPSVAGTDLLTEGALHYVVGLPATNMPQTGSAVYQMIGHTTPSLTGTIASASITGSSIAVDFQWAAATVNLSMNIQGEAISGSGLMQLGQNGSFGTGGSSIQMSGGFCSFQSMSVNGFLAGDGASRAGMAYVVDYSGNVFGTVSGAIAYQRGALEPSSPSSPFSR